MKKKNQKKTRVKPASVKRVYSEYPKQTGNCYEVVFILMNVCKLCKTYNQFESFKLNVLTFLFPEIVLEELLQ